MRYFVHPESCCAWKQEDSDPVPTYGLVEEVTYEQYLAACAAWGEEP